MNPAIILGAAVVTTIVTLFLAAVVIRLPVPEVEKEIKLYTNLIWKICILSLLPSISWGMFYYLTH